MQNATPTSIYRIGWSEKYVTQALKCPVCGANDLTEEPKSCRNCGKILVSCSECGSLNATQVAFCVNCGGRLANTFAEPTSSDEEGGSEEPYVVWEGLPFAMLERRSQSKRQFLLWFSIYTIIYAMIIVIYSTRILHEPDGLGETGLGDTLCFLLIVISFFVGIMLIYWWSGRELALEEGREKRI